MNYKNLLTAEIINSSCYQKLPLKKQENYIPVVDTPTHTVNEYNGGFMLYLLPTTFNSNFGGIEGLNDTSGGIYDGF
jgi:hypothetical protein